MAAERKRVLRLVDDLDRNRIEILRSLTMLRQLSLSPVLVDQSQPDCSAKIDTLVDLWAEVTAEGHRALVFCQFTNFLALVRTRLAGERIGHQYLDGRTRKRAERMVYRLVSENTIEGKVVPLQERKRDLFVRVVDDGSGLGAPLSADDIRGRWR